VGVSLIGGGNYRPTASRWQTLSHNVVSSTPRWSGIPTRNVNDDTNWKYKIKWVK